MGQYTPRGLFKRAAACLSIFSNFNAGALGVVLFFIIGLTACDMSLQEPLMPTWSVDLNVPIGEETFQFNELVNDSTIVVQGADSLLFLSLDGSLESFEISTSEFDLGGISTAHTLTMGTFKLDNLDALETGSITLGSFVPELGNLVAGGQTIPFTMTDTVFSPAPVKLSAGDFIGFRVHSGELSITFTNNLPFPVGPSDTRPDGFQVSIYDSTNTAVVDFIIDEVVETGQTVQRSAPIGGSGGWVYAPLEAVFVLPIAETTTFQLNSQVLNTAGFEMDISLAKLEVDEAIAQIDRQEVSNRAAFAMDDRARLRQAILSDGSILLDFQNQTDVAMNVDIALPNVRTPSGIPYTDDLNIPANGVATLNVPLTNLIIAHEDNPGAFVDSMIIDYNVETSATGNIVHLRSSDQVSIEVYMDSLRFSSLTGHIANETFEIESFEQRDIVDYAGIPNNIQLDVVDFALTIANEVNIENLELNLVIVGYHEENGMVTDSARLEIAQRVLPGTPGNPRHTVISVPGEDAANFLNILPTRVRSYGEAVGSGEVDIAETSTVGGEYSFSTPLRMMIDGEAVYTGDVNTLNDDDIGEDLRTASEENFNYGQLLLSVTNGTPLSGSMRMIVSADPLHTDIYDTGYFNPEMEFVKEIVLAPAPTDPNSGYVNKTESRELSLTLSGQEFRIFQFAPLKVGFELRLDDTQQFVSLRATDFISITGLAKFNVVIKE